MVDTYRHMDHTDTEFRIPSETREFYQGTSVSMSCLPDGFHQYTQTGASQNSVGTQFVSSKHTMNGRSANLACIVAGDEREYMKLAVNEATDAQSGERRWWNLQTIACYENRQQTPKQWKFNTYTQHTKFIRPPEDYYHNLTGEDFRLNFWRDEAGYRDVYAAWQEVYNIGGYLRPRHCTHSDTRHGIHDDPEWLAQNLTTDQVGAVRDNDGNGRNNASLDNNGHPYHYFGALVPGRFNQCIVDSRPTFIRDGNPDTPWIRCSHPYWEYEGDTTYNYWDSMVYNYFMMDDGGVQGASPVGYGNAWHFDNYILSSELHANDELATDYISGLTGAYDPQNRSTDGSNGEFHVSFSVTKHSTFRAELRWSRSPMHGNGGWASGTDFLQPHCGGALAASGTPNGVMPFPPGLSANGVYPVRHFWTDEIDPATSDFIYLAIRPYSADITLDPDIFREICIPIDDGALPPHLAGA